MTATVLMPRSPSRILVVDDSVAQRQLLCLQLSLMGFDVSSAGDGAEALEIARVRPFDAVVCDVLMPRLDGFEFCLAARRDPGLARVPVVLCTQGEVEEDDRRFARDVGARDLLSRGQGSLERLHSALLGVLPEGSVPAPVAAREAAAVSGAFASADASDDRFESLARFSGHLAHDLNNLMLVVLGHAELIAAAVPPGSPAGEDAAAIQQAVTESAGLTGQLLAIAGRQDANPVDLDLGRCAAEACEALRPALGGRITLHLSVPSRPVVVRMDAGQLGSVLRGLLDNAREAMPAGGRIEVEVASPGDGTARLAVSDAGVGMDASALARLFEPYSSTKDRRGAGMSLATGRGSARQAGGSLRATSLPGRGSRFELVLPERSPGLSPDGEARR